MQSKRRKEKPHTRVTKRHHRADLLHGGGGELRGGVVDELGTLGVAAHDDLGVGAVGEGLRDQRRPVWTRICYFSVLFAIVKKWADKTT